jgi:hypothetical protein
MSDQPASPEKKSFSERFRSKPENAAKAAEGVAASKRIPRSTAWFTKIHDPQLDAALSLGPFACTLYTILAREHRRHRGKPFILPTDALTTVKGLSRRNLHRILIRMESCGLIAIGRRPPKPPIIAVRG